MSEKQAEVISKFFSDIISSSVRPAELVTAFKTLMDIIDKKITTLSLLVTKNKTENEALLKQTNDSVKLLTQKINSNLIQLNELVNSKDSKTRAVIERELKYVWEQIKMLVDTMPKSYNDSKVLSLIEEVRQSIPKIDNTELKQLKKKLSELEIKDIDGLAEALQKITKMRSNSGNIIPPASLYRPLHETHTVGAATTSIVLAQGVSAEGTAIFVRYQGQTLDFGEHFTVSGNRITFSNDVSFVDNTIISVTYWP